MSYEAQKDAQQPDMTEFNIAEGLQTSAIRSELTKDEEKRVLAGLGFLGVKEQIARFTLDNAFEGAAIKTVNIIVPRQTLSVFLYFNHWLFKYGPRNFIRERPLGKVGVFVGVERFQGNQVTAEVRTLLRDINADDPWEADVNVVVACFG